MSSFLQSVNLTRLLYIMGFQTSSPAASSGGEWRCWHAPPTRMPGCMHPWPVSCAFTLPNAWAMLVLTMHSTSHGQTGSADIAGTAILSQCAPAVRLGVLGPSSPHVERDSCAAWRSTRWSSAPTARALRGSPSRASPSTTQRPRRRWTFALRVQMFRCHFCRSWTEHLDHRTEQDARRKRSHDDEYTYISTEEQASAGPGIQAACCAGPIVESFIGRWAAWT